MIRRTLICIAIFAPAIWVCGCAPPGQSELEKSIRDEMKSKNNVNIVSFDLKKQDDGTYVGTATADNGDVYDVKTKPPSKGKMEWETRISDATLEKYALAERDSNLLAEVTKVTREGLEQKLKTKVTELNLSKVADNKYEGTAETENKKKLKVKAEVDGMAIKWESEAIKD
jgi:uncharacterized protein with FMN-binding domain